MTYVMLTTFILEPKVVESIILATLCLHNFLRKGSSKTTYCPVGLIEGDDEDGSCVAGTWRQDNEQTLMPLEVPSTGHNVSKSAKMIRENFTEYFTNEGAVEWQWDNC